MCQPQTCMPHVPPCSLLKWHRGGIPLVDPSITLVNLAFSNGSQKPHTTPLLSCTSDLSSLQSRLQGCHMLTLIRISLQVFFIATFTGIGSLFPTCSSSCFLTINYTTKYLQNTQHIKSYKPHYILQTCTFKIYNLSLMSWYFPEWGLQYKLTLISA